MADEKNSSGNPDGNNAERYVSGHDGKVKYQIDKKFVLLVSFAVLLLIIGIILIVLANHTSCDDKDATTQKLTGNDICDPSEEASRVKLMEFLAKVRDTYYEVLPEEIAWKPDVHVQDIWDKFRVHDPKPANIKLISDTVKKLLTESEEMVCHIFIHMILC